jgi:ribosomal protein S18 acetylase RimI-like enzyme
MAEVTIAKVSQLDLSELLPLMRAYCDFYEVEPRDDRLIALSRALIDDAGEGLQLIARDEAGEAVGFATVYWTWQTLDAGRVGVMNDLYVAPDARGGGVGRKLIEACRGACRKRGVGKLVWETAPDNTTAQRLYDSTGAESSTWLAYEIEAW